MTPGLRSRRELARRDAPAPERDRVIGGYVLGILMIAILIGVAVDAFVRPAYFLMGMP